MPKRILPRRNAMFRKSLAVLTAVAALGFTATIPTTADAGYRAGLHRGAHHYHFGRHHHVLRRHIGPRIVLRAPLVVANPCMRTRHVLTPLGWRPQRVWVCG
jgi:hypothetical protein